METLEQIRKSKIYKRPYPKGVRVKVVKIKDAGDRCTEVAVVDSTGCLKAVCYDGVGENFHTDECLLIRGFSMGASGVMNINKHSRVSRCRAVAADPEAVIMAEHLLEAVGCVAIGDIHRDEASFIGRRVSIEGVIVEDELPRQVKGGQTVRNIKVKDDSGSMQVALWNQKANSPIKSGDKIKIMNVAMKRNDYLKAVTASTTAQTTVDISVEQVEAEVVSVEQAEKKELLMLTCEVRGELVELHMTKDFAMKLWESDAIEEILNALDDNRIFCFVLRGRDIIDLAMTDTCLEEGATNSSAT